MILEIKDIKPFVTQTLRENGLVPELCQEIDEVAFGAIITVFEKEITPGKEYDAKNALMAVLVKHFFDMKTMTDMFLNSVNFDRACVKIFENLKN